MSCAITRKMQAGHELFLHHAEPRSTKSPAKASSRPNTRWKLAWVLFGLLVLEVSQAQVPDPACESLHARGIACSTTPNAVGPWTYTNSGSSTEFASSGEAISAWEAAVVAANNGPNRSCSLALKESKTNFQGSGRFDYGRFVDATQVGSYSYDLHCVDTSFGYPVTQLFGAGMYVLAKRLVGCTPPQHEVSSPETAMCVGLSQPVVQLKNLGPVDKNSPRADRIIEATVTNAANGNAPIGGLTITLDVVTDTTKGDAGLLLSTTYPSQYWPGSSTRAITDSTGKTTATFSWPPSLRPAPVQRIRGCDLSGLCTGTLDIPLDPSVVIGFFNGVWNTEDDALGGLRRLEREFGPAHNDSPLKYELFYNQTGCGDRWYQKGACMKDVAEVFIQRSAEIDNQVWGDRGCVRIFV